MSLPIRIQSRDRLGGPGWRGEIAGRSLASDRPLLLLEPDPQAPLPRLPGLPEPGAAARTRVAGLLLERSVEVAVAHAADGSQLGFPDGTLVRVDHGGQLLDVQSAGADCEVVLLGPALLLALALQGVYCLHASALQLRADSPAWVVAGASGAGKSTLAACAVAHGGGRICDDLCLLQLDVQGQPQLLPRFPQLKWPAAQHWPAGRPGPALAGVAELQRGGQLRLQPLDAAAACQLLLRHSVATRLFPPALLARHLRFCATLASSLAGQGRAWHWQALEAPGAAPGAMLALLAEVERMS